MAQEHNFTSGKILPQLIGFMLPVFFAMFLQSLYGAVDLLIAGKSCRIVVFEDGRCTDVDIEEGLAMKKEIPESIRRLTSLLAR